VLSGKTQNASGVTLRISNNVDKTITQWDTTPATVKFDEDLDTVSVFIYILSGTTINNLTFYPQLTLGSTPQPYVPYGHVGMEARDPDTDELISCTALPLPSRGWVAGLSDGTADALRLDGAGKCEWTLPTSEVVLDGSSVRCDGFYNNCRAVFNAYAGVAPTANNQIAPVLSDMLAAASANSVNTSVDGIAVNANGTICLCYMDGGFTNYADVNAWLSTHNVTVLYPLATPVTEDCGYVDMPAIPSDAQISIPELDALGIRYFVDDTVTQYGREIYARVRSEYADRLTALEQAVAELATS
jgi:hypothetical protein